MLYGSLGWSNDKRRVLVGYGEEDVWVRGEGMGGAAVRWVERVLVFRSDLVGFLGDSVWAELCSFCCHYVWSA